MCGGGRDWMCFDISASVILCVFLCSSVRGYIRV